MKLSPIRLNEITSSKIARVVETPLEQPNTTVERLCQNYCLRHFEVRQCWKFFMPLVFGYLS